MLEPDFASCAQYTELYYDDRRAFYELASQAWRTEDFRAVIGLGRIAQAHGALDPKLAQRLWRSYIRRGDFPEALSLMLDPALAGEPDDVYLNNLRDVWAGLGRLDTARSLTKRKLAQSGREPSRMDEVVLSITQRLRDLSPDTPWSKVEEAIGGCVRLRLFDTAARILQLYMLEPRPRSAPERDAIVAAAAAVFTFIDPILAPSLLRQVARMFDPDSEKGRWIRGATEAVMAGVDGPIALEAGPSTRTLRYCFANACAALGLHEAAIGVLGGLSLEAPKEVLYRQALAYSVGERNRRLHPVALASRPGRRVFDVFPYNGERDMLAIKLAEMADWIDHFVIVEFKETFTGEPKPVKLPECGDLLERYGDKIIHVVEERFPACVSAPWAREFHQRERGVSALGGLVAPQDMVLISDADEIADRRAVEPFAGDFASLRMDTFRFYLNSRRVARGPEQPRTGVAVRGRLLADYGAALLRTVIASHRKDDNLFDAGWHFSCIGDAERMVAKMQNSSHQEYRHYDAAYYSEIIARVRENRHEGWETCSLDDLPEYVRANRERLAGVLL